MDPGFNPLTGISSILTYVSPEIEVQADVGFQSPDGDFVYSDCFAESRSG